MDECLRRSSVSTRAGAGTRVMAGWLGAGSFQRASLLSRTAAQAGGWPPLLPRCPAPASAATPPAGRPGASAVRTSSSRGVRLAWSHELWPPRPQFHPPITHCPLAPAAPPCRQTERLPHLAEVATTCTALRGALHVFTAGLPRPAQVRTEVCMLVGEMHATDGGNRRQEMNPSIHASTQMHAGNAWKPAYAIGFVWLTLLDRRSTRPASLPRCA